VPQSSGRIELDLHDFIKKNKKLISIDECKKKGNEKWVVSTNKIKTNILFHLKVKPD
jgi:hypothetical protein